MKNLTLVTEQIVLVTVEQFASILNDVKKSSIMSIMYLVDDNRSKVISGKKQVQKQVQVNQVFLNHDYTKKVQKLTGDENFEAQPLKGKQRISSTILMSESKANYGKLMLDGKVLKANSSEILNFFHEGNVISEAKALSKNLWANSYFKESTKDTMGRGTVSEDDDFSIINPYIERIQRAKLNGTVYEILK